MNRFKLILKGVLLYSTILITIFYACAIDSIYNAGYFFYGMIIVVALWLLCLKFIKDRDIKPLSFQLLIIKSNTMTRTILVVYTNKRKDSKTLLNSALHKKYAFLCKHDFIKVGDMIEDRRYSTLMQVVCVMNIAYEAFNGYKLKVIEPNRVNGIRVNVAIRNWEERNQIIKEANKIVEQMESRNIKVNIEEAKQWYNSGNATLRTLALNAYSKDELEGITLQDIFMKTCTETALFAFPKGEAEKATVIRDLHMLAKFFNKDWRKTTGNTGYFIGIQSTTPCNPVLSVGNLKIYQHNTVVYAGIPYFRCIDDAKKAIEILGEDRISLLF